MKRCFAGSVLVIVSIKWVIIVSLNRDAVFDERGLYQAGIEYDNGWSKGIWEQRKGFSILSGPHVMRE